MALRAQRTRHLASWCDTVASVPTRLSVSSTIMRIRRRRRRSKIGERTSIVESIAYLLMLSYRAQTGTFRCAFLTFGWLSGVGCRLSERLDAQQSSARLDICGSPVG